MHAESALRVKICFVVADWQAAAMMGSPGELSVQQGETKQAVLQQNSAVCTGSKSSAVCTVSTLLHSPVLGAAVLQPEASFHYPPAEASSSDVINSPELFHATLKKVSHSEHTTSHCLTFTPYTT